MSGAISGYQGTQPPPGRSNTLGWTMAQIIAAIEALDIAQQLDHSAADRSHVRHPFQRESIGVTLIHPGGSRAIVRLASQDISQGGLGLLHSHFLHPGSGCIIELPRIDGGLDNHEARIAGCRHAGGKLHILGVRFGSPIDLSLYLPAAVDWRSSADSIDPAKIRGSMLLIEPNDADAESIERSLDTTLMTTSRARTGTEASALNLASFNMVACAESLPDVGGDEFLSQLRLRGTTAPFIIMLSESNGGLDTRAGDAGVAQVRKPISGQFLHRVISELLDAESARKARRTARNHRPSGSPAQQPVQQPEPDGSWWDSRS